MMPMTVDPTVSPTATPTAQPATPSATPIATPSSEPTAGSLDSTTFVDTMAGVTDHLVLLIWIAGILVFLVAFLAVMAVRR